MKLFGFLGITLGIIAVAEIFKGAKASQDLQLGFSKLDFKDFKWSNPVVNVYLNAYNPNSVDVPAISVAGNLYYESNRISDIDMKFNPGSVFHARQSTTFLVPVKLNGLAILSDLYELYLDWKNNKPIDTVLVAKGFINYDKLKNIPFDTSYDVKTGKMK